MITSKKFEAIGSIIEIKIDASESDSRTRFSSVFDLINSELARIESKYSRFRESELSKLNNRLGKWIDLDEEFLFLIKKSLDYNKKTNGYFDITVKSTLDKMGYDKNYSFTEKNEKKNILSKLHNSIKNKLLDSISIRDNEILLRKEIDFGGIGKGYAIDKISEILELHNIQKYYINGGGDIRVKGEWIILLEHPDNIKMAIGKVILKDNSIASSAPNRRKWGENGKLHHLINPKTEKPANDMKSVFILAKTGMDADVYATSLFAAGFLEAIKLYKKLGIEVLLISSDNKYYVSDGFKVELYGENK